MKNLIYLFILVPIILNAQVGIGTTSPNSTLDIRSTNQATPTNKDGLLIPKIDEYPATNPTTLQDGMLVFVTGNGSITKGFYYWDNTATSWVLVNNGSSAEKINDLLDGKSDNDGTDNGSSIFLGIDAGLNDDGSHNRNVGIGLNTLYNNSTGNRNIAIGFQTLFNNIIGEHNVANGYKTLVLNTNGNDNTATGYETLYSNTTGKSNVGFGFQVLRRNTDGDYNIGIGNKAGYFAKGDRNIFIGNEAGEGTANYNIDRSIFLGNQAGRYETNSNRLYIENSQSTTPLIYGEFDNDLLRVNGELQVGNPTTTGYKLPTVDGVANQVLKTNGVGALSWVNNNSSASGLEKITENGQTGWRLIGRNPLNYGDIGIGAIDLSYNDGLSTTRGATGKFSLATGKRTTATGIFSTALGGITTATGNYATAMGDNSKAESYGQTSVGVYNTIVVGNSTAFVATDRLFVIGNGVNNANKSDALTILKNGTITAPSFDISEITDNKALVTKEYVDTNFGSGVEKINDLSDGKSDTNGSSVYLGLNAGLNSGANKKNVGIGYQTLQANSIGSTNTALGYQSMKSNTSGFNNVALGAESLFLNTSGHSNVALGDTSLYKNTSGDGNIAIGWEVMKNNLDGNYNIANGYRSLYSNTSGDYNLAHGYKALYFNTTGNNNTANGYAALYSNTTGNVNVANGYEAMRNNTTGKDNVANGYKALRGNTVGEFNVANGSGALRENTAGSYNTASGYLTLNQNTTGEYNVANGYNALYSNTTGTANTAIGMQSLNANTTGGDNVAVGNWALSSNTIFNYNTAIGNRAANFMNGFSNTTAIGSDANPSSPNQVRLGNASVSVIGGYANWSNFSDKRIKTNIKEDVKGLEFIKKLRPVSYNYNMDAIARFEKMPEQFRQKDAELLKAKEVQTGFIAQEVEAAAQEAGFNFHGVVKPHTSDALYAIRYAEFVVPLVKAIQELDSKNKTLESQIQEQQTQIETLKKELAEIKILLLKNKK